MIDRMTGTLNMAAYGDARRTQAKASAELWVLLQALDTVEHGIALHDRLGQLQFANRAYREATAPELGGDTLGVAICAFSLSICALAFAATRQNTMRQMATSTVSSSRGEYRLRGTYIAPDLLGSGPSVLVVVEPPQADRISVERLRAQHRLTRAQARVAHWLVQGFRNAEIAERLFLSEHTVRHHVEQIRAKVGGHTRAAVAARLQGQV